MRHRAHIAGRLATALLVALWAAQPVLAALHAQEHAHRYCPTHRAFEEVSARPGSSPAELLADLPAFEQQAPSLPGGSLLHEACAFYAAGTREELASHEEARPLVLAHLEVSRPATAPPHPHRALSALDTAPKASPPVRA
jgi:hypothetical protein